MTRSKNPRAIYPAELPELPELAVTCPACDAEPGDPCVTGSGKIKEDTHKARRDAFAEMGDGSGAE